MRQLGNGVRRGPHDGAIDAVGVDAERPKRGPAAKQAEQLTDEFASEVEQNAPETGTEGDLWKPGDAPSQAARWYVDAIARAGTVGIIGVYPLTASSFPIGQAMNKNLVLKMGNAEHRRWWVIIKEALALRCRPSVLLGPVSTAQLSSNIAALSVDGTALTGYMSGLAQSPAAYWQECSSLPWH